MTRRQFFLKWLVPKYGPALYSEVRGDLDSIVEAEKKARFEHMIDEFGKEPLDEHLHPERCVLGATCASAVSGGGK